MSDYGYSEKTNRNMRTNSNMSYEKIFSFIKKRTDIPDEDKIIYQYTNIEALFNGIIVKEPKKTNEEICLWASHYMYLNDPTEIAIIQEYINEILDKYFVEKDNDKTIIDLISDTKYFITSFSTTLDSLPMWSMYGKNGSGIALGFDKDAIHRGSKNEPLCRCVYLDKEVKNKIEFFCERYKGKKITKEDFSIGLGFSLFAILLATVLKGNKEQFDDIVSFLQFIMGLKSPAYNFENEIRLIVQPEDSEIKYRSQNNLIIPYTENFFPKKVLKEIWIGPTNDMERTEKSLRSYLDNKGFSDVKICRSIIPLRK